MSWLRYGCWENFRLPPHGMLLWWRILLWLWGTLELIMAWVVTNVRFSRQGTWTLTDYSAWNNWLTLRAAMKEVYGVVDVFRAHLQTAPNSTLSKNTALKRLQHGLLAAQASLLWKIGAGIEQIYILVSTINRLNGSFSGICLDVERSVLSKKK